MVRFFHALDFELSLLSRALENSTEPLAAGQKHTVGVSALDGKYKVENQVRQKRREKNMPVATWDNTYF